MATMKAVRFHSHGGPDKLVYEDAPAPQAGPGEALIQVQACGLNRLDLWVRQGIPAYPVALPHILGSDICGTVLAGDGLPADIAVGDEVVVYPGLYDPNGQAASLGKENLDPDFKVIGGHVNGGYAEQVVVPSRNLLKKPPNLSSIEAAAYPLTFITAWHMLATRAQVKEGENVLILGAGSGVGVAGVQIARYLGAHVMAATTHAHKADKLKALGADVVIVGHPQDLAPKVLEATHDLGVEVVFEHVGPATWEQSIKVVAKGGRIVTCGATTGPEVPLILRQLFGREITLLGSMLGTFSELQRVSKLIQSGKLKPVVDRSFPLEQARAAQETLLTKEHTGKLVLDIAGKAAA
jgi:NADPH:quinone reductase-like Zn-dependent oxidoreductase